jgi:hypothetical protein
VAGATGARAPARARRSKKSAASKAPDGSSSDVAGDSDSGDSGEDATGSDSGVDEQSEEELAGLADAIDAACDSEDAFDQQVRHDVGGCCSTARHCTERDTLHP